MGTFVMGGQTVNGNPTGSQNINITTSTVPSITFNDVDNVFGAPVAGESVSFTYNGVTYTNVSYTLLGFGNVRNDPNEYAGFIRVDLNGDGSNLLDIAIDMTDPNSPTYPDLSQGNTKLTPNDLTTPSPPPSWPVACFASGTLIDTPDGPRKVEEIEVGDLVNTLDNGPQPVVWAGRRTVPGTAKMTPITISAGALGNDRDLTVSPQHRMLLTGWRAELYLGQPEVLASALSLVNDKTIRRAPCDEVTYHHLLFAEHEVIMAEGCWSESFNPGNKVLAGDGELMAELRELFPERFDGRRIVPMDNARPVVSGKQAKVALFA